MFNKLKIKFFYGLLITNLNIDGKNPEYDEEEKDTLLKNKDDWNKFVTEHNKNGYIVYTNEFLETLEKIDKDGEMIPIISLIFIGSNCSGCRPYKTTPLIKNINRETNKVFSTYKNISNNNQIGYKVLFVLINLDEKETNPQLTKFLREVPNVYAIPNLFFLCRNKKCENKECKKNKNKPTLINNYAGTYLPLEKWLSDILIDPKEGVFKKIQTHSFKEK